MNITPITWLLLLCSILSASTPDFTEKEQRFIAQNPAVTIGITPDFIPVSFREQHLDQLTGYSIELLKLIEKISGLTFEFSEGSWARNLERFQNGKLDMIDGISYREDRTPFTRFTTPYYEIPTVFYIRDDFEDFHGVASLKGKTVGIEKDIFFKQELRKIPGVLINEYESYETILKALAYGRVDVVILNLSTGNYYARTFALVNVRVAQEVDIPGISREDLRFGIRPDQILLHSIIQKSLDSISSQQWMELQNRWMGASQFTPQSDSAHSLDLTDEERIFLQQHPVLRVSNETNWPPYDFYRDGVAQGYSVDVLRLLAEQIGVELLFVTDEWNALIEKAKRKEIDIIHPLVEHPERHEYLHFTSTLLNSFNAVATQTGKEPISKIADLYGRKVAMIQGYSYHEDLHKRHPSITPVWVNNALEGLLLVSSGNADVMIEAEGTIRYLIHRERLSGLEVNGRFFDDPSASISLKIGVRKDWPVLRDILNKALLSLTPADFTPLNQKWFGTVEVDKDQLPLSSEETNFLRQHPVIRVSNETDWPPFDFAIDGEPRGYSIDMLQLIEKRLGVRFEFINGYTWVELLEMFKQGNLDLLHSVAISPSRKKYMLFTDPYISYRNQFVIPENAPPVHSIEDLQGKTIASPAGWMQTEYMQANHPGIKLLITHDNLEAIKKVGLGEADAALESQLILRYLQGKNKIDGVTTSGWFKELDQYKAITLHLGVRTDWPMFQKILNKALAHLTPGEIQQIDKKWFGEHQEQQPESHLELTPAEAEHLKRHGTINMCVDPDWMPFEGISKGKHNGIGGDMLRLIEERSGLTIHLVPTTTWTESLEAFKSGQCDILSMLNETEERSRYMNFTRPYLSGHIVFVGRNDHPYIADFHEISNKRLALVKGYSITELLTRDFHDILIQEVESYDEAYRLVAEGKADLTADYLIAAGDRIQQQGLYNLKVVGNTPYQNNLRIGVQKDLETLRSILDKTIASLEEHEVKKITNQWMSIRYEHGFDYGLMWKILLGISIIILFLLFRQYQIRQHNRQTQKVNSELEQTIKQLQNTQEQLVESEKMASLGRLVAGVAHELNTPLGICITSTSHLIDRNQYLLQLTANNQLKKTQLLESLQESNTSLGLIENNLRRSSDLIQGFKQLALEEHDDTMQEIDFVLLLNSALRPYQDQIEALGITLQTHIPDSLRFQSSFEILKIVFSHLISNVLEHAFFEKRLDNALSLSISKEKNRLVLLFEDNGAGMESKLVKEIFQPFFTTARQKGKVGLGLSIVYNLITLKLNGSIECRTAPGEGTQYQIELPLFDPLD